MPKVDHEKLGELLSAYLDNELVANERSLVDKLLREDAAARRLLAELRETSQLVSSLPRHAAPASIATDLQSRLERAALLGDASRSQLNLGPRRSRRWIARLSLAAMLVIGAFGIYWFSSHSLSIRKEQFAASNSGPRTEINGELAKRESTDSAVRPAKSNKPIQLQPPLDAMLAEGAPRESVANHTFDSEPVVLQITAVSEKDRVAVANALTDSLRSQGLADLGSSSKKSNEAHVSSDSAFFVSGKAGVNYQSPEQQQILVHAPRSQVDAMFAALPKSETASRDVQFRAGDIVARGVEPSRQLLPIVQSQIPQNAPGSQVVMRSRARHAASDTEQPSDAGGESVPTTASTAKSQPAPVSVDALDSKTNAPKGAYFGGLLKMFGLDPALLAPFETKQAAADQAKKESDRAPAHAAPTEPPSLVAQGLNRLGNDSAARQDEIGEVSKKDTPKGKSARAAAQKAEDPTITVVVQIMPSNADQITSPLLKPGKPPATPPVPTGRTKSK